MSTRLRMLLAALAAVVLGSAAILYTMHARATAPDRQPGVNLAVDPAPLRLGEPGRLVFRNTAPGPHFGVIASVSLADPGGPRRVSQLRCERFSTAAGRGLCVAVEPAPTPRAVVLLLDDQLRELKRIQIIGTISRARLSADGEIAAWTTFVTGDAYNSASFSTRTGIYNHREDRLQTNIEEIPLHLGGQLHMAEDVNFWGVSFTPDNETFYATVSTGGRTHLVRAAYQDWQAETLRENVECPSLSPDGKRIAFKKRIASDGARPWRIHVLDLATMTETAIAEPAGIDDQVAWLDEKTLVYGLPGEEVWTAAADGSGTSRKLVSWASSPSGPGTR
ncbi:TolB-like translocation protein [Crossiella cryophila]|uniref:WD40-like Beta Propeller Repeat n=1 Tax=Crossiella cryophila TaxID=43355 RepID=A0A7W7CC15_9PSEU|nr:PD40 domain-containing protein [Crossiella cryophila]MBB4677131.1 hypothetical protein [Crossiella cryophila]